MAAAKHAVLFSLVFALTGAIFGVGGLASLQAVSSAAAGGLCRRAAARVQARHRQRWRGCLQNTPDEVQDAFKPYNFM